MVALKGMFISSQTFQSETGEQYFVIPCIGMNNPPENTNLFALIEGCKLLGWVEEEQSLP